MAAAAIIPLVAPLVEPLAEAGIKELINWITGLVHKAAPAAEAARGGSTGPVKFADVFVSVMSDLTKAKAAGQISTLPDDATAKLIIQSVVTSMQLSGQLDSATAALLNPTASTVTPPSATHSAQAQAGTLKYALTLALTPQPA